MHVRGRILILLLAAAAPAAAQWQPQWTAAQPSAFVRVMPTHVIAAPDGALIVGGIVRGGDRDHPTLLRFGSDGAPGWTRDLGPVRQNAGFAPLAAGRIAAFGRADAVEDDVFVHVVDGADGSTAWQHTSTLGGFDFAGFDHRLLVEGADGGLFLRLRDAGYTEMRVLRLDADGAERPPWHHSILGRVRPDDLVALADGGVAVVSHAAHDVGSDGVWAVTRFGAGGEVRFETLAAGDGEFTIGAGWIAAQADGGLVLGGNLTDADYSDVRGAVWKLDADGRRAWITALDDPPTGRRRRVSHFLPAADGDVLLVAHSAARHGEPAQADRLVRVSGADGRVRWEAELPFTLQTALESGYVLPESIAEAPNGRLLAVGASSAFQIGTPRAVEYTADGTRCRVYDDAADGTYRKAAGSAHGWSVAGWTRTQMFAQRLDADGPCEAAAEAVFADGFDAGTAP